MISSFTHLLSLINAWISFLDENGFLAINLNNNENWFEVPNPGVVSYSSNVRFKNKNNNFSLFDLEIRISLFYFYQQIQCGNDWMNNKWMSSKRRYLLIVSANDATWFVIKLLKKKFITMEISLLSFFMKKTISNRSKHH